MATRPKRLGRPRRDAAGDDPSAILNSMTSAAFTVGPDGRIAYANLAAETMFDSGAQILAGAPLTDLIAPDAPLHALIRQVRDTGSSLSERDMEIEGPRLGSRFVSIELSPMIDCAGVVLAVIQELTIARRIGERLAARSAGRSMGALALMLAHEVKNPLSGIRGAAQLLEQNASESEHDLTRLICDEADRIVHLLERMEAFADERPSARGPVNIHALLEHVRKLAASGFGANVRFVEIYDPSLPPVHGSRDQLVQILLNLVKNAVEAAPNPGGEVVLSTAYRHGVRLAMPGGGREAHLPLEVSVSDNGPGVPADLRSSLFDPFVTAKPTGTGLGLAMVSKLVNDHGGAIEHERRSGRTVFRVMLPRSEAREAEAKRL